jgi:hypothetical protein
MRRISLTIVSVALVFFGLGVIVADSMSPAVASPVTSPQEGAAGYSGTDGALMVRPYLIVIRGKKVYRIDPSAQGGAIKPWSELVE